MKKIYSLLLVICLVLSCSCSAFASGLLGSALSSDPVGEYINQIEKAKMTELEVDSIQSMVDKMAEKPAAGNEWWIMSIRNYHEKLDYVLYRNALESFVKETPPSSAASKERCALALLSLESTFTYADSILDSAIESNGINTNIFGLHLITNGAKSNCTKEELITRILAVQCEDGGWSLTGTNGDPDMTSMAIQALALYKENEAVNTAIEKAIAFLSTAQLDNGGYTSYGNENPESPAQVVFALASVGIDAKLDDRFVKNGNTLFDAIESFKISDGVYSHTHGGDANATAQAQIYYSYIAYEMFLKGQGNFYTFSKLSEEYIERKEVKETKSINIKLLLYIAIAVVVLALCIVKLLKKEKKAKSYLSIALVGIVLALLVSFVRFETTDKYYQKEDTENPVFTTISIYCDTIKGKDDYIPKDGKILEFKPIEVKEGASVYEQLVAACREYKIQMESEGDSYVNGIANIYEYKFGELSGWMFKVNGEFSDVGCNQKKLKDGDYVEWVYTTNLGKDVGDDTMVR